MKSSHPLFLPHLLRIVCYPCHEIHPSTILTLFHWSIKIENPKPLFLLPAFLCLYFPTRLISALPLLVNLPWLFQSGIIFILEFQLQKKGLGDWTCPLHFHSSKIIISKLPALKKGFQKLQHIFFHCKRKAKSLSMIKIWSTSQKGMT